MHLVLKKNRVAQLSIRRIEYARAWERVRQIQVWRMFVFRALLRSRTDRGAGRAGRRLQHPGGDPLHQPRRRARELRGPPRLLAGACVRACVRTCHRLCNEPARLPRRGAVRRRAAPRDDGRPLPRRARTRRVG